MPKSKQSKQSNAAHPNTALPPDTPKVSKRKRTTPSVTLPVIGGPLPVVKIPVVTPHGTSIPIGSTPNPTSSGTTPATPVPIGATVGAAVTSTSSVIADPPTAFPSVPASFTAPLNLRSFGVHYPNQSELAAFAGVITDLGNFADYDIVLGSSAPAPSAVTSAVTVGVSWRNAHDAAAAWNEYAKVQNAYSWKVASTLLEELKAAFRLAQSKNVALATQYPSLAAYCNASKSYSAKAAATKKAKAVAKASVAATATAAATAAATASAIADARAAGAASVVAPGKGVTVNNA